MTTVMNGLTFDKINDIISNFSNYDDLQKYEICVYNEADSMIRLTVTRIEDSVLLLNAFVKDE